MSLIQQFDTLHEHATQATGLSDFGDDNYCEPMRAFLSEVEGKAEFNETGADSVAAEVTALLVGRLMATESVKQTPGATLKKSARPLIIIGLPRTGTTVLQRFLFQDEQFQVLPLWLAHMPMPRPPRDSWESHPGFQQVAEGLEQLDETCPQFRQVHPMAADQPDECRLIINHSFWSPTLAMTNPVPDYRQWVLNSDPHNGYDYYRQALSAIGYGDDRPWLLKDPSHLFALDKLLELYPDACIVQTHRDPVPAITSISSLALMFRNLRERNVDPEAHGLMSLESWAHGLQKAEQVRQQHSNQAQFFDIYIDETRRDPIGTVERMYRHFGIPITEQTRARWQTVVDSDPRMGHATHTYSPEFFGLTQDRVYDAVGDYYDRLQQVRHNADS